MTVLLYLHQPCRLEETSANRLVTLTWSCAMGNNRLALALITLLIASILSGCATMLSGRASQFHALDGTPRSFWIVPAKEQQGSLEFASYAKLLRSELVGKGWREAATFMEADVAVFMQYAISAGREVTFSYPVFGSVPTGTSTTTGTVSTFGGVSTINATTTQQTTLGVVGSGVGSRTEFDRALRVTMYSMDAYRRDRSMERVYEGMLRSSGSTGELPAVMPALIHGMFQVFPGESGGTRNITVEIGK